MRSLYQASPWQAPGASLARSFARTAHTPTRLGTPSGFFIGEPFMPVGGQVERSVIVVEERVLPEGERPIEGVNITRPVCRCKFGHLKRDPAMLGQGCSPPTGGGSGSATFDGSAAVGEGGGSDVGTIALAAGGGLVALWLLGVL